jgi:hypothetical protein
VHLRGRSHRFDAVKFPLFSKKPSVLARASDRQAELERLLAQSFRALGQLLSRMADVIDHDRLERQGYGEQERFLKRVDRDGPPKG